MSDRSRAEQARLNGARSKGPVTEEGKARSVRNALKHGRYAKATPGAVPATLLRSEAPALYRELLKRYTRELGCHSPVEKDLLAELCDVDLKLRRFSVAETRALDHHIALQAEDRRQRAGSLRGFDQADCLSAALGTLLRESPILHFTTSVQGRLLKARRDILDTLFRLRKERAAKPSRRKERTRHVVDTTESVAQFEPKSRAGRRQNSSISTVPQIEPPDGASTEETADSQERRSAA